MPETIEWKDVLADLTQITSAGPHGPKIPVLDGANAQAIRPSYGVQNFLINGPAFQLTNPLGQLIRGSAISGGVLNLPAMNVEASPPVGFFFVVQNTAFLTINLKYQDGTNFITLLGKERVLVWLVDNTTANGTFEYIKFFDATDTIPGSSHQVQGTDAGLTNFLEHATDITLTVPTDAEDNLPFGSTYKYVQGLAGKIVVTPQATVTVQSADGALTTRTAFSPVYLTKRAENIWYVEGDLIV